MGVRQRVGDFASDSKGVIERESPLALEPLAQRFAFHERHHEIKETVGFTRIVDRQNVGVGQACGDADLAEESLGTEGDAQVGAQHLQRHQAMVLEVAGAINDSGAAPADLAVDRVPGRERGRESGSQG